MRFRRIFLTLRVLPWLLVEEAILKKLRSRDNLPSSFLGGCGLAKNVALKQHWLQKEKNYIGQLGRGYEFNVAPEQQWPLEGTLMIWGI